MNLFTKMKKSLKATKKLSLRPGLSCLIIGLCASATQAEDNATKAFQPGKWPDAYQRLRENTREEILKEEVREQEERKEEEEREKKKAANQDGRTKPTLENSQLLPSTFQDIDIELNLKRNSPVDLLLRNSPKPQTIPEPGKDETRDDHKADREHIYDDADETDDNKADSHDDKAKQAKRKEENRLKKPVVVSPNDWVPDKFDPLNNGGFTTAPDNGSPVPYRLNGHLDLERGRPWLHN